MIWFILFISFTFNALAYGTIREVRRDNAALRRDRDKRLKQD